MRPPLLLAASAFLLVACGPEDRPPHLSSFSNAGAGGSGSGGDPHGAGDSGGSGSRGGATGTGGSGSSSGAGTSGATGGFGGDTTLGCSTFDADAVYLHGTLGEGIGYLEAFAPVGSPRTFCVGFPSVSMFGTPTVRRSDGVLIYSDSDSATGTIREFVPETLVWDDDLKRWDYPDDPVANDVLVATPTCVSTVAADLHTIPEDGTVVFRCSSGDYQDGDGNPFGKPGMGLLAIGPGRLLLAESTLDKPSDLVLIDSEGNETPVTGGPDASSVELGRATENGFWIVENSVEGPLTRWHIDSAGVATPQGTYCSEVTISGKTEVALRSSEHNRLDGNGDLFQRGYYSDVNQTEDVVVKRVLSPGSCEVVYDEANLPDNTGDDWGSVPNGLAVRIHGSYLVTGR